MEVLDLQSLEDIIPTPLVWVQHETNPLHCSRSFTVFVFFLQGGVAGSILNWMICFHPLSVFNYALQTIQ